MVKRVYLCEKPKVAQALAQALGVKQGSRKEGYIELANGSEVTYLFGHLLELAPPDVYLPEDKKGFHNPAGLPLIPQDHEWIKQPSPEIDRKTRRPALKDGKPFPNKQLGIVVERLKSADVIVQCGDVDREGQLIADETIEFAGFDPSGSPGKPVERLPVVALTEKALKKLIAQPRQSNGDPVYVNLRKAGEERSRADWLMGMNLSRALSASAANQLGHTNLIIPYGRVRTPTANIVLQRDLEIENFKSVLHFVPVLDLDQNLKVRWKRRDPKFPATGMNDQGLIVQVEEGKNVLSRALSNGVQIIKAEVKSIKKAAPLPFNLSTLQAEASAKFNMTAQQVSKTAQSLYEDKRLITYIGTDTRHLPTDQIEDAPHVLKAIYQIPNLSNLVMNLNLNIRSACWNDEKVLVHHAIIPTEESVVGKELSTEQLQIYEMIARRYMSQFMPDYEYKSSSLELQTVKAGDIFGSVFQKTTHPGWHLTEGTTPIDGSLDAVDPEQLPEGDQ